MSSTNKLVTQCTATGCKRKVKARALCGAHLHRLYRYGDVSITSTGHVKAWLDRVLTVDTDACVEFPFARSDGYGVVRIDGALVYAHRYVADRCLAGVTGKDKVLHSCDNPPCCNRKHLRWGDDFDNMERGRDRWSKIAERAA